MVEAFSYLIFLPRKAGGGHKVINLNASRSKRKNPEKDLESQRPGPESKPPFFRILEAVWLLTFAFLILAPEMLSAASLSEKTAASLITVNYSNSLFLLPICPEPQKKPATSPLHLRIQEFLVKKVGLEPIDKLEQELKPLVNTEALDLYLFYYWLRGQPLEGLCLSRLQLRLSPADPILLNNAAAFLYAAGEQKLASEALAEARAILPDNAVILSNSGVVNYLLGQPGGARKYFLKAVSLDNHQPEANRALHLMKLQESPAERFTPYLKNSLSGAYRESLARLVENPPIPLAFQQEIYSAWPDLPEDFESYYRQTPYYQSAFLRMEGKEVELRENFEKLLAAGLSFPETEFSVAGGLALSSARAYMYLTELEGKLDYLEREIESPADMKLSEIVARANSQLETLWKDYQKKEKACLRLPREERIECIKKAQEEYCLRYRQQSEYFYQSCRKVVLSFLRQADPYLKDFVGRFYFWLRYLPEEPRTRKKLEAELRLWRLYQRLWEKSFLLLTRLPPPAFKDCLPPLPLEPETSAEPIISLYDPSSGISIDYEDPKLTFRFRPDRVIFAAFPPLPELSPVGKPFMSTVHLYPPETSGGRPLYLVLEADGKLSDIGELGPWAYTGLSTATSWRILLNLSLPESLKEASRFP
ncbi:MAG: hypothetical protein QME85_05220 [Candidatus Saccharicenans sp.]|nr:hypothetical protein [Candidatus Saccharicenans sp.]